MDRAAYDRYLTAFNARDYDGVLAHFADSFELSFGGYMFRTKDAVRQLYAFLHAHVNERITVHRFVSDARTVAMEADVRLEALDDMTPEMLAEAGLGKLQPMTRGQIITIPQFIHYHLDADGKIVRALCAIFEPA